MKAKGSVSLRRSEKSQNSKIKIAFIAWSQCVLQCLNLCEEITNIQN